MDSPHLRVAITTNSLINLDANLMAARQVVLYDVNRSGSEFVDVLPFSRSGKKGPGGGEGMASGCCMMEDQGDDDGEGNDPIAERVAALEGCSILFTMGMSDLAAMRVADLKVFPVKCERMREIDDVLDNVQRLLASTPPLWIRRVMRNQDGTRLALDDQEI